MTNNIPDYFLYIDKEILDLFLKDDPINDEMHRQIISAIYTLLYYRTKNDQSLNITFEDIARTLYHRKYDDVTDSFIKSVTEGVKDIYKWDQDHGNLILGKGIQIFDHST